MRATMATGLLLLAACRSPESIPVDPLADVAVTAIYFEPALPEQGTLTIAHESGFSHTGQANPSGCDVRVPPGPANLTLTVAGTRYELSTKFGSTNGELIWRWRSR